MTQYLSSYFNLREEAHGGVLFLQMGAFAECYGADARAVAQALAISLTRRGYDDSGVPMPMCGVPLTSLAGFEPALRQIGRPVAVAVPNGTEPPTWRIEYLVPPDEAPAHAAGNLVSLHAAKEFEPVHFNMAPFQDPAHVERISVDLRSVAYAMRHDEAELRRMAREQPEDIATLRAQIDRLRNFALALDGLAEPLAARIEYVAPVVAK